jgi:hypothetical protein
MSHIKFKKDLTREELIKHVSYDKDTGVFIRLKASPTNKRLVGMFAGSITLHGYMQIGINGDYYLSHRLAWLYVTGSWPDGEIDHIDHCRTNNRFSNLRAVDCGENNKNISFYKKNKTGVMGVVYREKYNRYVARINNKGKEVYLGCFKSFDEACKARLDAEINLNYHVNHGK